MFRASNEWLQQDCLPVDLVTRFLYSVHQSGMTVERRETPVSQLYAYLNLLSFFLSFFLYSLEFTDTQDCAIHCTKCI